VSGIVARNRGWAILEIRGWLMRFEVSMGRGDQELRLNEG
jgi:hypothetical protein